MWLYKIIQHKYIVKKGGSYLKWMRIRMRKTNKIVKVFPSLFTSS